MSNLKKYILLFLFIPLSLPQFAQSPFFKSHPFENEFPNIQMELIYEDPQGLLWLGTSAGLFQYDGIHYSQYLKTDSSSNFVSAIYQDREQILWVGYKDGSLAHLSQQTMQAFPLSMDTIQTEITGIVQDDCGRIWIATYGQGIFIFLDGRIQQVNTENGLAGNDIYVMSQDQQNRIWIGTDGGIHFCWFENEKFTFESLTRSDGLPDDIVKEILPDWNGNMWIGMYDKGVCFYDVGKRKFVEPPVPFPNKIVNKLALFKNRELWIGTDGHGLWRYSFEEKVYRPISEDGNYSNSKIYDLHKDIEGNVWVLSNDAGLRHANRQFEFFSAISNSDFKNIQAILTDHKNNLWVGTDTGLLLAEYDENNIPDFKPILKNKNIISLFEDKFNNIWIGTFGVGVYIFNKESNQLKVLKEEDGITNNSVLSINGIEDQIWLATLGGVTEINIEKDIFYQNNLQLKNFNQDSGLGTNFIYKIFIDSKKRVWFATDGKGISVLENGKIKNYSSITLLDENQDATTEILKAVYSITEDKRGHIWFSTAQQGIFEYDGQSFRHLTVKEGIRDLEITSLITDANGNILIVHPSGIDILNPETHHLIYYDKNVGISKLDPNINAVCKDKFDDIWIASQRNIIKYTSLNESLEIHPRTRLRSVSIFLEPIDFSTVNNFSHDQNNLVFEYIGIWYTDPKTVRYRYQLEGYDKDWIFTADTKVTYSNLSPGDYVFRIMSTENDSFSDEPEVTYSFTIHPPFWYSWWFILTTVIILFSMFYWYQNQRDRRIQKINLLEKEKVASQLEVLKAQINPHFLFNSFNTLVSIIEENPDIAVEYVDYLSDYYRTILQYRDKDMIPIHEEIELIKVFNFLLKKRFGDNFNLNINLNGESFYIVPMTLQMLVENAVKHNIISKNKPLYVEISLDNGNYITVSNNLQEKINSEKSTGFGLQSIRKRYKLITDKNVEIEKTEKYFKVRIPAIRESK